MTLNKLSDEELVGKQLEPKAAASFDARVPHSDKLITVEGTVEEDGITKVMCTPHEGSDFFMSRELINRYWQVAKDAGII